ncbi:MAG: UDP-N-acetylglucosamine 2-epimerase (non-hydrolyzing) [Rhizomicrobium sp.]
MRLVTVLGTRPQFVKAFPLSRLFMQSGLFDEVLVHTGQHFDPDMSDVFFHELGIEPPRYFLDIHGGNHGEMTGRMLESVENILVSEKPQAVVVYGDTNSTLAGALAAAKLSIPIVHIEAGLRSYNRQMPEEINRVLVDHLSTVLLCPTTRAVDNLKREGIVHGVHQVGDLTFDAAQLATPIAASSSKILEQLGLEPAHYGVATLHRAENVDNSEQLARIASYLRREASLRPLILPLHPRTRDALRSACISLDGEMLKTVDPLGYFDMCQLVRSAEIVITDSGGLQREAYFHRVPCVTLRDETEWGETVEYGWNRMWTVPEYAPRREIPGYGTAAVAGRIAEILHSSFAKDRRGAGAPAPVQTR